MRGLFPEVEQAGAGDDGDVAEGGLQVGDVAGLGPLIEDAAHAADHGVGLGVAEEVHLADLVDQVPQLDDRAGVELALVLGHGGENVGGGFVDRGAQLLDQVAQEAVDHLLLLLAGFGGDFLVHADQGVTAGPVGLVADRDGAPEVVTFQFFALAFEVAFGLDPFLLGGVFGQQGRERDVGVFFLPAEGVIDLFSVGI